MKVGIITFGSEVNVMMKPENFKIPAMVYYDFNRIITEASKIK